MRSLSRLFLQRRSRPPGRHSARRSGAQSSDAGSTGQPGPSAVVGPDDHVRLLEDSPLRLSSRGGRYVVTDEADHLVGTIRGDYVVGFTAEFFGLVREYDDLDAAKSAVAAEHARRTGLLGDPPGAA